MRLVPTFALAILAALAGCAGTRPPPEPAPAHLPEPAPPAPEIRAVAAAEPLRAVAQELPPEWSRVALSEFGALLERAFPAGERRTWLPSALEELQSALAGDDPIALRAALLLARAADPVAGALLCARLELRRAAAPGLRLGHAVDLCAAAALGRAGELAADPARLEALAFGRVPHPDLEVRVECAASAVELGSERSLGFLFSILRHGTTLAGESTSWTPLADMSLCQRRAAEALCRRAGLACRLRELAPLERREAEVRALEAALLPGRPRIP